MIEGAVIALVAAAIGWIARGARKSVDSKPPARGCSCGHPRGKHIEGKVSCKAEDEHWDVDYGTTWRECKCQVYDGPEPLLSMYAPEIEG